MIPRDSRRRGFTLIEMLVALTILALLGVIGWRGLDQLLAQRARASLDMDDTERIVRTLAQMERDLATRVPDALFDGRVAGGGTLPLALELTEDDEGRQRVRVIRLRPAAPGAINVVWAVERDRLTRTTLPVDANAAGAADALPDRVDLLSPVERLEVRVLLPGGWTDLKSYARAGLGAGRVGALEITLERAAGEKFVRVIAL
ncbi:MAG: prepilin-type N-terminal cleavage/methylation domain-containing protein [Betaproteobacteria bacterium]